MMPTDDDSCWADPEFEPCLDAFRRNLSEGQELGAACAIYRDGRQVLDVCGGITSSASQEAWRPDTAVPVFSVTKGLSAICVLMQAEHGLIDLDRPVSAYWPEFGANGKDRVTVREALGHRAGVPMLSGPVTIADIADTQGMAARLASEPPVFKPGSAHGYHALTIGWITSELVRRVAGQSLGAWFRDHVAKPLDLNIAIGRPANDGRHVASIEVPPEHDTPEIDPRLSMARPIGLNGLIVPRMSGLAAAMNNLSMQQVELAGANAVADARSLARFYAATLFPVGGERLLSDKTIADACRIVSEGEQWGGAPGQANPVWGAGLMLPGGVQPMLGEGSFGHDGAGGALAFAHAPSGVSFAYVRNRTGQPGIVDPQVYRVVGALAEILGIRMPSL